MMVTSCLAFLLALGFQETKPKEDIQAARDEAAKALTATVKSGNFSIVGRATLQTDLDDDEPTECRVSGSVGSPFQAALRVRSKGNAHEIYLNEGIIAGRSIWKGRPFEIGEMPNELLSLLDLPRLETAVERASSAKAPRKEKLDLVDCRVIELALPPSAIRSYLESEEDEEQPSTVAGVDLGVWIDDAKGIVLKLEATIRRVQMDEDNPADETKTQSTCTLTLTDHGKAKVKFPAKIKEKLEE